MPVTVIHEHSDIAEGGEMFKCVSTEEKLVCS